jgi:Leucine-rich repeat (LRR) protein
LSAHKNALTSLPPSISRLSKLSRLSLYENQLADLPAAIGGLASLQEL